MRRASSVSKLAVSISLYRCQSWRLIIGSRDGQKGRRYYGNEVGIMRGSKRKEVDRALPDISRNGITSLDLDQIARNNLARGHNHRLAVAYDVGGGG